MSRLKRGSVVRTITRHGNHLTEALKGFYEALLIHGTCTRNNAEVEDALFEFGIGEFGKFRTRDEVAFGRLFRPNTDLATNFARRTGSVTRHNSHVDTCAQAIAYGGGNITTNGVGNCHNAEEGEILCLNHLVIEGCVALFKHLVSKPKRTHSEVLIIEKHRVERLLRHIAKTLLTQSEDVFRSTLHVKHLLVQL